MNKEEIENNRIPKEIAKALGIEKEDKDSLIAFKENLYEQTVRENVRLKKELKQKESMLDKVTDTLKERLKELDNLKENYIKLKEYDQVDFTLCKKREVQNILNIIEGEKK